MGLLRKLAPPRPIVSTELSRLTASRFQNEFIGNTFLAILVFSVLDACNFFVSLSTAPFVIGMGYAVVIWAFS